jgi:hypothetical protein
MEEVTLEYSTLNWCFITMWQWHGININSWRSKESFLSQELNFLSLDLKVFSIVFMIKKTTITTPFALSKN